MEMLSNNFSINISKQNQPTTVTKEVISNSFNINVDKQVVLPNEAPVISDISISNVSDDGTFTITYKVIDTENDSLTHKLKLNSNGYISISPSQSQNVYTYRGSGLVEGDNTLYIQVSDGKNVVESNKLIVSVVLDNTDIDEMIDRYSEKVGRLRESMQQVQNKIAQNKSDTVMNYAKSEIKQLADSIQLKVEKNGIISSINQTAEEIKIDASKINLHGAVSITNPTYEDRYIKIENDSYIGVNKDTTKMVLGFKSPRTGQSENSPVIALGHDGVTGSSPYLLIQDYPAIYNPIGLQMAFSELAYQFKQNNFSSLRFLGNGSIEVNTEDYVSVGTYKAGKREDLLHIKKLNGKGCIGTGTVETETISAVVTKSDTVQSGKALVLTANAGNAGVVLYGTNAKCFEPVEGQGGQIYCGSSWSPWKGVYSQNQYSSNGIFVNDATTINNEHVPITEVISNINFISPSETTGAIHMDVTRIKDTDFVEVDSQSNVFLNESEMLKLLVMEVQQLKNEINHLKATRCEHCSME